MAAFDVVEKRLERNTSSYEYRFAPQSLGIYVYHSVTVWHLAILTAFGSREKCAAYELRELDENDQKAERSSDERQMLLVAMSSSFLELGPICGFGRRSQVVGQADRRPPPGTAVK